MTDDAKECATAFLLAIVLVFVIAGLCCAEEPKATTPKDYWADPSADSGAWQEYYHALINVEYHHRVLPRSPFAKEWESLAGDAKDIWERSRKEKKDASLKADILRIDARRIDIERREPGEVNHRIMREVEGTVGAKFGCKWDGPRLLFFHASGCIPCAKMKPLVAKLPCSVESIDASAFPSHVRDYSISRYPTLVLLDDHGKETGRIVGLVSEKELRAFCKGAKK